MNFEAFKKVCNLALEKYRKAMFESKDLSNEQRIERLKQCQLELIPSYTEFIKSEDTLIGKQAARLFIKLLKKLLIGPFINKEIIDKFTPKRENIEYDPVQWVVEQYDEIIADLEPDIESMIGDEEEIERQWDSGTKNSEMLKKYKYHLSETQEKIRYLMYLVLNIKDHQLQSEVLHAFHDLICIMQNLSFDLMIQFKGEIDELYKNILKDYFSNEDGRTLHIVNVFDGSGDFVHMQNWLSAYEKKFPGKSDVIIVFSKVFHNETQIEEMIQSLPENHFLKNISANRISIIDSDNINIELKRKILGDKHFSDIRGNGEYSALYAVSYLNKNLMVQLRNYSTVGLNCCMINEMGTHLVDVQYPSFTIGVSNQEHYCGCFFEQYEDISGVEEILPLMSERLQELIFGEYYETLTVDQKLQVLDNLDLIVGYYQKQRNTYPLEFIIDKKIQEGKKTKLIVTGHNELPDEIQSIKEKLADENFSVGCCRLDDEEYKILMRLLQFETRHLFFATGDNTLGTSISIGKPIVYLNRNLEHEDPIRESKAQYVSDFNELLYKISVDLVKQRETKAADLLLEVVKFINLSLLHAPDPNVSITIPSSEALTFFKTQITPYLKTNFDLDKNITKIIEFVEHKQPLKFNVEPIKLQAKDKKPRHNKLV